MVVVSEEEVVGEDSDQEVLSLPRLPNQLTEHLEAATPEVVVVEEDTMRDLRYVKKTSCQQEEYKIFKIEVGGNL